jgi:hypothetical protein
MLNRNGAFFNGMLGAKPEGVRTAGGAQGRAASGSEKMEPAAPSNR